MHKNHPSLFAAIHVGSEQVSLQIVEYHNLETIRVLENIHRQISLGEETFQTGRIGTDTVAQLCDILKGFRRKLTEYGVRDYRLMATTAIREAANQPYIIDQIQIKADLEAEVIDMPQEIFFKYVAIFRKMQVLGLTAGKEALLFVDITSGGLGITLYRNGRILYQQNIHIGVLRIKESFNKTQRDSLSFQQALGEYIFSVIEPVRPALAGHTIRYVVLSGPDTELFLQMLGRKTRSELDSVKQEEFLVLYKKLHKLNLSQVMQAFALSEAKADMALPTIILYQQLLSLCQAQELAVVNDQFLDGMTVCHIAQKTKHPWTDEIDKQTFSLIRSLAKKYHQHDGHSEAVAAVSLQLFDKLHRAHGLGKRERQLLEGAALLHDIGKFVSLRSHYLFSHRLILSSDILGFSEKEKLIMACVAQYHSKGTPRPSDPTLSGLSVQEQMTVAKLAAIIRLADAIDRTHRQKALKIEFAFRGEELLVTVTTREDYALEQWTFADKASFFENVFGIRPILIRQAG